MTSPDAKETKQVDSPDPGETPANAASDKADESTELTVQDLEERIAPLIAIRKQGGDQL